MGLTLRPTGLALPVYEDLKDYEVLEDGESIGRIYEICAPTQRDLLWCWSITVVGAYRAGIETDGRAHSFETSERAVQSELRTLEGVGKQHLVTKTRSRQ